MRVFLFLLVILLTGCSSPWTRGDSLRQGAYFVVLAADWHQTGVIATEKTPYTKEVHADGSQHTSFASYKYKETNPILGERPSQGEINRYFAVTAVANTAVAVALPKPYRVWWQWASIIWQAAFVTHNIQLGVEW